MLRHGFGSRRDAEKAMQQAMVGAEKATVVARSTLEVADYLAEWPALVTAQLRPSTYHSYELAWLASRRTSAPAYSKRSLRSAPASGATGIWPTAPLALRAGGQAAPTLRAKTTRPGRQRRAASDSYHG